ncbi:hypothetical protein [Chitinophaga silvatica]|uniref:hypothetical protein n=1 Tax=Chitinophaga silvatica TaxID=2282649 RepID=UPI0013141689|nr:hypothetical protein [Chitinophaga silvatica]
MIRGNTTLNHSGKYVKHLYQFSEEIRPEVIVGLLLDAGISESAIIVNRVGGFCKPNFRDLLQISLQTDNIHQYRIALVLSRDSFYDLLPQVLFHKYNSYSEAEGMTIRNAIKHYKIRLSEEQAARKFFMPWENEFFFQQVLIEQNEKNWVREAQILEGLIGIDINMKLPAHLMKKFTVMLPYVHLFSLNSVNVEQILQWIFDLSITINQKITGKTIVVDTGPLIGNTCLGIDMVAGIYYHSDMPIWEIVINVSDSMEFRPFGENRRMLDLCYKYLVPADIQEETTFRFEKPEPDFFLQQKHSNSFIGYNIRL